MKKILHPLLSICAFAAFTYPAQASAEEIFVGANINGIETPFSADVDEDGVNIQFGIRGEPEKILSFIGSPSLYALASINTQEDTSFIAGGISWHFDLINKVYFRPGIGIAVQDRSGERFRASDGLRIDLGSTVLFEPELVLGLEASKKVSVELTWLHVSHAHIFDRQNPGIDMMGARLAFKF